MCCETLVFSWYNYLDFMALPCQASDVNTGVTVRMDEGQDVRLSSEKVNQILQNKAFATQLKFSRAPEQG